MHCTKPVPAQRPKVPDAIADDDFKAWLRDVDHRCQKRWALRLDDLPDLMTRHAFDAGVTPEEFFEDEVRPLMEDEYGPLATGDDE